MEPDKLEKSESKKTQRSRRRTTRSKRTGTGNEGPTRDSEL
jgi:hypothetical protein